MLDSGLLMLKNTLFNRLVQTIRQTDRIKRPTINYKRLNKSVFPVPSLCENDMHYSTDI